MTTRHKLQPNNLKRNVADSGHKTNLKEKLIPLTNNVEDVFLEAHNYLRDIDGLPQEEVLDELCKLIMLKIFDELQTPTNDAYKLQNGLYNSENEFANIIRGLYKNLLNPKKSILTHDEIVNYPSGINLSNTALVKSITVFQDYSLTKSDTDIKGRAFQKVISPASRAGMGQYFTPDPVVKFMVSALEPNKKETIIDPFCGSAHFLTNSSQYCHSSKNYNKEPSYSRQYIKYIGVEKSKKIARLAMIDSMLSNGGDKKIICSDSLLDFKEYTYIKPNYFDIVLTNPPFGSLLTESSLKGLGTFELAITRKKIPLELLGLERSIQLLKAGGRMAIVLPEGILTNRNTKYVRNWLTDNVRILGIVGLPSETFAPFGANVKTSVLFARKWKNGEVRSLDYEVFMGQIKNIGYDAAGRIIPGSDINEVVKQVQKHIRLNI